MKLFTKILPWLIVVVLLCLLGWLCNSDSPDTKPAHTREQTNPPAPKLQRSVSGTVITENKAVQANRDVWQNEYYKSLYEELKEQLKLKDKQIEQLTAVGSYTEGQATAKIDTVQIYGDTGHFENHFTYADKWLYLRGKVVDDALELDYRITDSIQLVTYTKRKWFLGRRETFVSGFSLNPKTRLEGLQQVKLTESIKPKKWAIGLQAGYGFNGAGLSPYVGIGVTRTLIRF